MPVIKAIKKPIAIEALVWDGVNVDEVYEFTDCVAGMTHEGEMSITTLEGEMKASVGDYIIKGVKGEFYPCKPDIFKSTYVWKCKCGDLISFESVGCIYCKN